MNAIYPQQTALIVVDMQSDFYSSNGIAARNNRQVSTMRNLTRKINAFVSALSGTGVFIIYTKFTSGEHITPDNLQHVAQKEGYTLSCKRGSGGEDFSDINIPSNATVIEKSHYDAFAYTQLQTILKQHKITTVLVCGVRTELCVDATAKRASAEGYETYILSDLTATYDNNEKLQQSVLTMFRKYYGFVVESSIILSELH